MNHVRTGARRRFWRPTFGLFTAVAVASASLTPLTGAMAASVGQGFEISPPRYEQTAAPGASLTSTINLRNITSLPITAKAVFNDFTAKNDTGEPSILADGRDAADTSMRSWFAPVASQTIQPGELRTFTVRVNVPRNAAPGGHYGLVRFVSGAGTTDGSSGVSLSASVGTLYLVTVSGDVKESLKPATLTASKNGKPGTFFQSGPITFTETIANNGNVHVKPQGSVAVTDMFGKKVADLRVNDDGGNVLPSSERQFTQVFKGKLLGRYTARLYASYGNGKQLEPSSITIWIIPWTLIAIVLAILIVLVLVLTRFRIEPRKRTKKK